MGTCLFSEDGTLLKSMIISGEDFRLDKDKNISLWLTNEDNEDIQWGISGINL